MKFSHILATALTVATTVSAVPAQAKSGLQLGQLNCKVAGGVGFVFGSSKNMECVFIPANNADEKEEYTGTIRKFGIDIGKTGKTVILWTVVSAERDRMAPGELAGRYVGVGSEATVGVGLGANVLVGGSQNAFALQPLSVSASTGINVAAGLQQITLKK